MSVLAACRSAVAARLTTRRVPLATTLSPVIRLSGHSPNQEAKCDSVFQRLISKPTSLISVSATITSIPSMRVRSTLQFAAEVKAWRVLSGWRLRFGLLRLPYARWGDNRQISKLLLQLLVALGDSFLVGIVHLYFLLQHKYQLRTPVAFQALGDLLPAGLNSRMTECSQLSGVTFSRYYRPHDRLSSQPTYIAD